MYHTLFTLHTAGMQSINFSPAPPSWSSLIDRFIRPCTTSTFNRSTVLYAVVQCSFWPTSYQPWLKQITFVPKQAFSHSGTPDSCVQGQHVSMETDKSNIFVSTFQSQEYPDKNYAKYNKIGHCKINLQFTTRTHWHDHPKIMKNRKQNRCYIRDCRASVSPTRQPGGQLNLSATDTYYVIAPQVLYRYQFCKTAWQPNSTLSS